MIKQLGMAQLAASYPAMVWASFFLVMFYQAL